MVGDYDDELWGAAGGCRWQRTGRCGKIRGMPLFASIGLRQASDDDGCLWAIGGDHLPLGDHPISYKKSYNIGIAFSTQ